MNLVSWGISKFDEKWLLARNYLVKTFFFFNKFSLTV